jgi:hypothetical protein
MTTKDAYWFSHDSNAKDDPKVVMMIEQLGLESYGIFWVLIETLRDQPEFRYPLALIPAIARRYNTTSEKVKAVIMNYGLFDIEQDLFFFSHSLINRMLPHIEKKEQARLAAHIRWQKQKELAENTGIDADAMRTHSDRNAIRGEESTIYNNKGEKKNGYDYQSILKYYNENCSRMPAATALNDNRKKFIRARINEYTAERVMCVIKAAGESDFLCGVNDKGWNANFDWIMKPTNFIKILEGNYQNKSSPKPPQPYVDEATGRVVYPEGFKVSQ